MLRTIFWYVASWAYMVITLPALVRVKYLEKRCRIRERDEYANNFSMMLARGIFRLTGSSVRITGVENIPADRAVLFVSNHQSHMDSAIIHGYIKMRKGFIADKEVRNIPILRTWLKYMKSVFIDRTDMRHNVRCMEESLRILKEGCSMVIYPEGRLDEGKQLGEFRKGCVRLAVKAGVPIVPLTMINSHLLMARDGSKIRSASVQCIISQPIETAVMISEKETIMIQKIRNTIAANLLEMEDAM
jgi:1-acyl-sn-glycerol-3-phosphate acyltransferase